MLTDNYQNTDLFDQVLDVRLCLFIAHMFSVKQKKF